MSKGINWEKIYGLLKERFKEGRLELKYQTPFELLVMAILASQESDKKVNSLKEELFNRFKTPKDFVEASLEEVQRSIRSINFYRRKAKLLKECCKVLLEKYGGEVPLDLEELIKLPGVGRKTANMLLAGFKRPAFVVDRHVFRVLGRLGLKFKEPDEAEIELKKALPKELWSPLSLLLMTLGKEVCRAKSPNCKECPICNYCKSCGY